MNSDEAIESPASKIDWRKWLVISLARGVEFDQLCDVLVRGGLERNEIIAEAKAARGHPYFEAALYLGGKLEKYAGLLDVYSDLYAQSNPDRKIPEIDRLDPETFFKNYYLLNRPLIVRGFASEWPALEKWNPNYLIEIIGSQAVDVCRNRDLQPKNSKYDYEIQLEKYVSKVPFNIFAKEVIAQSPTNDLYMTARNRAFASPAFTPLLRDIILPRGIIAPSTDNRAINFWFGPAGTLTPLHHDCTSGFLTQIYGRKQIVLIPSFNIDRMYNRAGVYSELDIEDTGEPLGGLDGNLQPMIAQIDPGDALFMPVGWWHHVRSLDISISLTLQNFSIFGGNVRWKRGFWIDSALD